MIFAPHLTIGVVQDFDFFKILLIFSQLFLIEFFQSMKNVKNKNKNKIVKNKKKKKGKGRKRFWICPQKNIFLEYGCHNGRINTAHIIANLGRVITYWASYFKVGQVWQTDAQQHQRNIKRLKFPRCHKMQVLKGITSDLWNFWFFMYLEHVFLKIMFVAAVFIIVIYSLW